MGDRDDEGERDGEGRRDRSRSRERGATAGNAATNAEQAQPPAVFNCYLTNLSLEVTEDTLKEYFSTAGAVFETSVVRDPVTKEPRGFGFVSFTNEEDFQRAIALNGTELKGRNLKVEKAKRSTGYKSTPGEYKGDPRMAASTKYRADSGRDRGYERRRDDRAPPPSRGGYDDRPRYDDRP